MLDVRVKPTHPRSRARYVRTSTWRLVCTGRVPLDDSFNPHFPKRSSLSEFLRDVIGAEPSFNAPNLVAHQKRVRRDSPRTHKMFHVRYYPRLEGSHPRFYIPFFPQKTYQTLISHTTSGRTFRGRRESVLDNPVSLGVFTRLPGSLPLDFPS